MSLDLSLIHIFIVGVDNLDFEVATRAIYRAFVTKDNRW